MCPHLLDSFSVIPSVVETMDDSMMDIYCCWLLHFPEYFHNFLICSKHTCSYWALLLNYWSTPMVTIYCLPCSGFNTFLGMTNYCSNYPIEIMVSTTFIRTLYLEHCSYQAVVPSVWKQIYYFPYVEIFWCFMWVVVFFLYCIGSDPNRNRSEKYYYRLVQWNCVCVF